MEVAQKHVAISGLSAKVEVGNAEALDFEDATFDFVTSAGVLHHTPDTERAVYGRSLAASGSGKCDDVFARELGQEWRAVSAPAK